MRSETIIALPVARVNVERPALRDRTAPALAESFKPFYFNMLIDFVAYDPPPSSLM